MVTVIGIDGGELVAVLDERGWTQGSYDGHEGVCLHGAIRLCAPLPGDAAIIEAVASHQGWGPRWNDDEDRTEAEVRALSARGIDITDEALAEVFGPQWQAVVSLVRRAAVLTVDEAQQLDAAGGVAWDAARAAARVAAWDVAGVAARAAAWDAAWGAARDAAGGAAWAAGGAAWGAAWAVATWDLATPDGPYMIAHRDLLIAPWAAVCGLPDGLLDTM